MEWFVHGYPCAKATLTVNTQTYQTEVWATAYSNEMKGHTTVCCLMSPRVRKMLEKRRVVSLLTCKGQCFSPGEKTKLQVPHQPPAHWHMLLLLAWPWKGRSWGWVVRTPPKRGQCYEAWRALLQGQNTAFVLCSTPCEDILFSFSPAHSALSRGFRSKWVIYTKG